MKVVVIGAGQVGQAVVEALQDSHDLTLIDIDPERLIAVSQTADCRTIEGDGATRPILRQAGIRDADLAFACTPRDEANLVAAMLIRRMSGVVATRVGYTGGDVANATYRNHGNHAEGIEVIFDPAQLSYRRLLELFFQIHDPTTPNRQGNDLGPSYRSGIYYLSPAQKAEAERTIADVDASGLWPGRVVTEVRPAGAFWEAEPEHQDYLERFPTGYTCHFLRPGWRLPKSAA